MEFVNESGLQAGWTLGFERDGRELLVVAVKATYALPANGEEAVLAEEQAKLTEADEFTGEPGFSAPLHETDYSHRKPKCDVVLNGSAHAPGGGPAAAVPVSLRVGSMAKSFWVFGARWFEGVILSVVPTRPEPFVKMPISYDRAFGGSDVDEDRPEKRDTYRENPIGVGHYPIRRRSALAGQPLPNTSETDTPIENTSGRYRPMSFGPVGRNFFPRHRHAGTYNQAWLDNHAPFWPDDFSYAYFQCAPDDQQVPYLVGDEQVELENLTPDGKRWFKIPRKTMPVTFIPHRGGDIQLDGVCDTLVIEPDLERFTMTWRVSLPLRRNLFELRQTIVGDMPPSWHAKRRAEAKGKTYYSSLAELVDSRRNVVNPK
jgi:hypothetical protein